MRNPEKTRTMRRRMAIQNNEKNKEGIGKMNEQTHEMKQENPMKESDCRGKIMQWNRIPGFAMFTLIELLVVKTCF